jgi:hypothetical protein
MTLAEDMAQAAYELLMEFGGDGLLLSTGPAPGEFDQLTGSSTISTPHQPRPTRARVGAEEIAGVAGRLVRKTVATTLVEPREGDTLTLDGRSYTVGTYTTISVQGVPIFYQAEVT